MLSARTSHVFADLLQPTKITAACTAPFVFDRRRGAPVGDRPLENPTATTSAPPRDTGFARGPPVLQRRPRSQQSCWSTSGIVGPNEIDPPITDLLVLAHGTGLNRGRILKNVEHLDDGTRPRWSSRSIFCCWLESAKQRERAFPAVTNHFSWTYQYDFVNLQKKKWGRNHTRKPQWYYKYLDRVISESPANDSTQKCVGRLVGDPSLHID
jgi:hypothetical protein